MKKHTKPPQPPANRHPKLAGGGKPRLMGQDKSYKQKKADGADQHDVALISEFGNAKLAITALRESPPVLANMGVKYDEKLRSVLGTVYAVAVHLERDLDGWQDFCRLPEWEGFRGPKPVAVKPKDVLRFCVRFAVGFADKKASSAASKYNAALSVAYREKVAPADVPAYLAEHTIEGLKKRQEAFNGQGDHDPAGDGSVKFIAVNTDSANQLLEMPDGSKAEVTFVKKALLTPNSAQIEIVKVKVKVKRGGKDVLPFG